MSGTPWLTWRGPPGAPERPLVVLAPGGGHLARIFYGAPGAAPGAFAAHHLSARGYDVLAVSYPSDHPAIGADAAGLTVSEWGHGLASLAVEAAAARGDRRVVLVGWSMAGRVSTVFHAAALERGLESLGFVGLAATAPLPGLTRPDPAGEPLTAAGYWDSATRQTLWEQGLALQAGGRGAPAIPPEAYARWIRCDTPLRLRGEPREAEPFAADLKAVLADVRAFDYAVQPLTAAVIPTSPLDARHALTDRSVWGFLNAQRVVAQLDRERAGVLATLGARSWNELRRFTDELPTRLTREAPGGHFFFLGEAGAAVAAQAIHALIEELSSAEAWLADFARRQEIGP